MAPLSPRVRARINCDFREPGSAAEVARLLAEATDGLDDDLEAIGGLERIQAAIVLWARGDLDRLLDSIDLSAVDWRDVLISGGLENEDWRSRLDAELGPVR